MSRAGGRTDGIWMPFFSEIQEEQDCIFALYQEVPWPTEHISH